MVVSHFSDYLPFPLPLLLSPMFWLLCLGLAATLPIAVAFALIKIQIRNAKSPLRKLPGPPSPSWLFGNSKQIFERGQSVG